MKRIIQIGVVATVVLIGCERHRVETGIVISKHIETCYEHNQVYHYYWLEIAGKNGDIPDTGYTDVSEQSYGTYLIGDVYPQGVSYIEPHISKVKQ